MIGNIHANSSQKLKRQRKKALFKPQDEPKPLEQKELIRPQFTEQFLQTINFIFQSGQIEASIMNMFQTVYELRTLLNKLNFEGIDLKILNEQTFFEYLFQRLISSNDPEMREIICGLICFLIKFIEDKQFSFILSKECIKYFPDENFHIIFENILTMYPHPDYWPIVLQLPDEYFINSLNALLTYMEPPDKKCILQRLFQIQSPGIFIPLKKLHLNADDIQFFKVFEFICQCIKSGDVIYLRNSLRFVADFIKEAGIDDSFYQLCLSLFDDNLVCIKEEFIKFFDYTVPYVSSNVRLLLIRNEIIEKAGDFIQGITEASSIGFFAADLIYSLICMEQNEAMGHVTSDLFEYLCNAEFREENTSMKIGQLIKLIQSKANDNDM